MTRSNEEEHALVLSETGLRKLSRLLALGCGVMGVVLPVSVGAVWFGLGRDAILSKSGLPPGINPADWLFVVAGIIALVPVLLTSAALFAGRRCFACVANGDYMARKTVSHLRAFGGFIALSSLFGLLVPTLIGLTLTADAGPGRHALVVSIGSTPLLGLLLGGMVWAIAAVMARAAILAEDHAQIV